MAYDKQDGFNETKENHLLGYIKIFRSLKNHWLWHDEKKLKWWLDILLTVNYSDKKILIKNHLIECNRGQSVKSLESWAKDWRTTKKTVTTFFKVLQKDKMISIENLKITTRITVCKYDSYNNKVNADDPALETQRKRTGNAGDPQTIRVIKDNKDNNVDEGIRPPTKEFLNGELNGFLQIEELKTKVLKDTGFVETFWKMGLDGKRLVGWLSAFHLWLEYCGVGLKQEKDYRTHFRNWIQKQPYSTTKPEDYRVVKGASISDGLTETDRAFLKIMGNGN